MIIMITLVPAIVHMKKFNNIAMSSDQISTDYNLVKNNCTYCSAFNNNRIFYNSSKLNHKYLFIYFKSINISNNAMH